MSRATVSYVLNGVESRVSEITRERVLNAARELGYTPNPLASALRGGKTSVVVIALPAWPLGPPVAEAIGTLTKQLDGLGYTPLVHFRHWAGPDGLEKACDRVRPVALVAPFADLPPDRVEQLRANGTRAILALGSEPQPHVPTLAFDQRLVGEVALEHLHERGHTHVVGIPAREPELRTLSEFRYGGAERIAARYGMTLTHTSAEAFDLGEATAVFAFNDELALDVLDRVPPGTAVVGVDYSPAARVAHLTSVELVAAETWEECARRLHALIEDEHADSSPIIVQPTLRAGNTT